MLNNKALYIQYDSGISSFDILYEGSKNLPRKTKKKLRKYILIQNYRQKFCNSNISISYQIQ